MRSHPAQCSGSGRALEGLAGSLKSKRPASLPLLLYSGGAPKENSYWERRELITQQNYLHGAIGLQLLMLMRAWCRTHRCPSCRHPQGNALSALQLHLSRKTRGSGAEPESEGWILKQFCTFCSVVFYSSFFSFRLKSGLILFEIFMFRSLEN